MTRQVTGQEFGMVSAARMADPDLDYVLLTRDGDDVVGVFARRGGGFESLCSPVPAVRPSLCGGGAGLGDESACPEDTWIKSEPTVPEIRADGAFTFPIGPVRGDTLESVGWRLRTIGDEILHLDVELDHKHRGIEDILTNATLAQATATAARVTGTTTVAHAFAFARAVESAFGIDLEKGAETLRCLAAEVERISCHLGDIGLLGGSTGLPVSQMEFLALKEAVLRSNATFSGHRYLRGLVVPGGVSQSVNRATMAAWIHTILGTREAAVTALSDLRGTTSFLDRLFRAGRIPDATVRSVRPIGPVGRAAGVDYDVRRDHPYSAYRETPPTEVPVLTGADAAARFEVLARELVASYDWLSAVSDAGLSSARGSDPTGMDPDRGRPTCPADRTLVGMGLVEGPRGPVAYRLVLTGSGAGMGVRVLRCAVSSPSRRNWRAVPGAIANGNTLQDVPIIDASFALSVAGAAL